MSVDNHVDLHSEAFWIMPYAPPSGFFFFHFNFRRYDCFDLNGIMTPVLEPWQNEKHEHF